MDGKEANNNINKAEPSLARVYATELQPLLQSLLSTLTDIDFEYDREREKVSRVLTDVHLRAKVLERLKRRHSERRDPYVKQLAILQERLYRQYN